MNNTTWLRVKLGKGQHFSAWITVTNNVYRLYTDIFIRHKSPWCNMQLIKRSGWWCWNIAVISLLLSIVTLLRHEVYICKTHTVDPTLTLWLTSPALWLTLAVWSVYENYGVPIETRALSTICRVLSSSQEISWEVCLQNDQFMCGVGR